ncbi:hypothetical protein HRbin30_02070 [bacterium HR30]|nr:hypothetical protein HRbin30_02070 [bacterium HR30]
MLRGVTEQPLQAQRVVEELLLARSTLANLTQPRFHLESFFQRKIFPLLWRGIEFGDAVRLGKAELEYAPDVFDRLLSFECSKGNDLCHAILTVFLAHVADDFVAALKTKIHVNVRHGLAFGIKKAFEQQVVGNWVNRGDAERVSYQASGCGTSTRTHRNTLAFRVAREVSNDEEVARKTHCLDDTKLFFQPLPVLALFLLCPTFFAAFEAQPFFEPRAG